MTFRVRASIKEPPSRFAGVFSDRPRNEQIGAEVYIMGQRHFLLPHLDQVIDALAASREDDLTAPTEAVLL